MKLLSYAGFFVVCFIVTTIALNLIWYIFVYGKLYYCSDPLIFPLMFPPFAHEGVPGDYYSAPPVLVNTLGTLFLLSNFAIPVIALKVVSKKIKNVF